MKIKFTYDYFLDELNRFWELCGKKTTTKEIALRGWGGLCYVAVNCDGDSVEIGKALVAINENLVRRLPYYP